MSDENVTPIRPGADAGAEKADAWFHSLSASEKRTVVELGERMARGEQVTATAIRRARPMTDAENDALQAIGHARAIADAIYNGTTGLEDGSSFLEELGPSSVNSLMHLVIEKLDEATEQIERGPRT